MVRCATPNATRLGELLGTIARHLCSSSRHPITAKRRTFSSSSPSLDGDRFEGRFRDGVHLVDTSDLMRRLTKEQLLTFDWHALCSPSAVRYTVTYQLSPAEAHLYQRVTAYVRQEFNRAEALQNDRRARAPWAFALIALQAAPGVIARGEGTRHSSGAANAWNDASASWNGCSTRGAAARLEALRHLPSPDA